MRRYIGLDVLARSRPQPPDTEPQEVTDRDHRIKSNQDHAQPALHTPRPRT